MDSSITGRRQAALLFVRGGSLLDLVALEVNKTAPVIAERPTKAQG